MTSDGSDREIEIKLRVEDADAARRLLKGSGFRVARRRTLESDVVYDTPEGTLRGSSRLLRVRTRGSDTLLTYKGPPSAGRYKDREEIETGVTDGRELCRMIERLGMLPSFRYEKYRTHFTRSGSTGTVMLDETPIGVFLELEGPSEWIDETAAELGFSEDEYITASYARLYFDSRAVEPRMPAQMLFGDSRE